MTKLDFSLVDRLSVPASLHDVDGRFLHMNASAESVRQVDRGHARPALYRSRSA